MEAITFTWDVSTGAKTAEGEVVHFGPREYITFAQPDGRTMQLTHLFDYEDREDVSAVWFPESNRWGQDEITDAERARVKAVITAFLTQDVDGSGAAATEVLWDPDGPYGPLDGGMEHE